MQIASVERIDSDDKHVFVTCAGSLRQYSVDDDRVLDIPLISFGLSAVADCSSCDRTLCREIDNWHRTTRLMIALPQGGSLLWELAKRQLPLLCADLFSMSKCFCLVEQRRGAFNQKIYVEYCEIRPGSITSSWGRDLSDDDFLGQFRSRLIAAVRDTCVHSETTEVVCPDTSQIMFDVKLTLELAKWPAPPKGEAYLTVSLNRGTARPVALGWRKSNVLLMDENGLISLFSDEDLTYVYVVQLNLDNLRKVKFATFLDKKVVVADSFQLFVLDYPERLHNGD